MNLRALLDNPAALIGFLRAVALAGAIWAPTFFTTAAVDSVLNALALGIPLLSLLFTAASVRATESRINEATATAPEGTTNVSDSVLRDLTSER